MEPLQLIRTLQFTDSFFPVGAFAYSDGLETAACNGQVRDAASLERWMDWFLERRFRSLRRSGACEMHACAEGRR